MNVQWRGFALRQVAKLGLAVSGGGGIVLSANVAAVECRFGENINYEREGQASSITNSR
jgi:hypothetical protein